MNTLHINSNLPQFIAPYSSNIHEYFLRNHVNDTQDNDLIKFDIARYVMEDLIYQCLYNSFEIVTDESKYVKPYKGKRQPRSKKVVIACSTDHNMQNDIIN